jgi:glycosyltransferase involved in cell wall biosynthesis
LLKVVFCATALMTPLTGLGQYALQLAHGLKKRTDLQARFFYGDSYSDEVTVRDPITSTGLRSWVRRMVPNAYGLHRHARQRVFDRGLDGDAKAVYHEPNYLAYKYRGPTIITVHDLSWIRHPETHPKERVDAMNRYFEPALRSASLLLTDSDFVKGEVIDVFGVKPEMIKTVPLGVDLMFRPMSRDETFPVLSKLDLRHGEYFLSVGTIEPRKNMRATIAAYAALPAEMRARLPLVIVGMKGWRTTAFERQLQSLADRGEVRVLGYLSRAELASVTAGALTLVYPSIYEGFGLPPLEAMGCGVPPITSDASSIPEVVGDSGLMVNAQDVDGLRAAMQRISEDDALRHSLGERALLRSAGFNWERCVEETVQAYRQVSTT